MYEDEFFKYAEMAGVKDSIIEHRESIPQEVVDKILQGVDSVKQFCNIEAAKADEYHKKINAPKPKVRIQTTSASSAGAIWRQKRSMSRRICVSAASDKSFKK